MKNIALVWILTPGLLCVATSAFCQVSETILSDAWSGTYHIKMHTEAAFETINRPELIIERTADANAEDLVSKYREDLVRWHMYPEKNTKNETIDSNDSITLRRFLMNDDKNEYEEFGWTALHKTKKMKCLDAGHLFICKTTKDSTVNIGEESFITTTGLFGIRLHSGLFDLKKVE